MFLFSNSAYSTAFEIKLKSIPIFFLGSYKTDWAWKCVGKRLLTDTPDVMIRMPGIQRCL